jgi:hypothetical protein
MTKIKMWGQMVGSSMTHLALPSSAALNRSSAPNLQGRFNAAHVTRV